MVKYKCFKNYDRRTRTILEKMKWEETELDLSEVLDKLLVPRFWTWEFLSSGTFLVSFILLNADILLAFMGDEILKKSGKINDLYSNNLIKFIFFKDNYEEFEDPILIIRNKNDTISIIDGNHRIVGYCMRNPPPKIKVLEGKI
jgi:hypothetical protein